MNIPAFIVVTIFYATISSFGLYLIKDASALISARTLYGGLLYGGGFCIWMVILRLFPLSIAFPVAAGSLIVATHLIARIYLGEVSTLVQTSGIVMIIAGIALVFLKTQ